jgi:PAS domain S-box-containing protein
MKIRSQLLLVMVVSLFLMTSLVAGVQMYTAYTQERQNMQGILQNQATQFSNQIETWFTLIRQSGHLFVNESFVQHASQEEMQRLLGNMHNELNAFDDLIVTRPNGDIANIYPHNSSAIGKSMIGYYYFQDTIASKTSQISKVLISPTTGKAVIVITQPIIKENGDLTGVLLQNIKLDLLQDMSEDAKIGQTGQTIVFTSDGKMIAPQNNKIAGDISYVPSELNNLFKKDLRNMGQFTRDDGELVMVATTRVKTPGWGVAVTITQGEVLRSFYDSIKYGVVTFCIIFLLLSFVSSTIFNKLFRSITTVTKHFSSMNEGNFASAEISEEVVRFAPQELKELCTTFNTMSQTIQNNMDVIQKTNEDLIISEERWQLALQGNNEGIWDWDIKANQTFFSARVMQMFGYDDAEIFKNMDEWLKRIHSDDSGKVEQSLQEHLAKKTDFFRAEYRFCCKDDSFKWAFVSGQAVWDEQCVPLRVVGSISDITQRKEAEEALRQVHEQLESKVERRTEDLLAMNEELQAVNKELQYTLENLQQTQAQLVHSEKMASLGSLVAGIAHEINTPVGVGVTATSHLQKITKDFAYLYAAGDLKRRDLTNYLTDSEEALSIIFSNLERASQLIRSFKQVSVDQSSEARRVFNIKQYLNEILLSLHPKLKRTQHKVTVQCEEKLQMDSYPGAFGQIITNLIMNSLIHAYESEQAGELTITILQGADKTSLIYSDDGKGMNKDVVAQIFNPFFTTKRGMGGTGLGLYILYNLVKQQFSGTIQCESELGKGTKFVIEIPVGKETHHGRK